MPHSIRAFCILAALTIGCSLCHADDPGDASPQDLSRASPQPEPIFVVANSRVRELVTTWTDVPAECLFDGDCGSPEDDARMPSPTLAVARMLRAKCYLYNPCDELPIEAIYRERLANHGAKIILLQPSSRWRSQEGQNQVRQQSLLAELTH